ncbi:MAG: hypothetical protein ABI488_04885 [Polyangiaceae bacterium]
MPSSSKSPEPPVLVPVSRALLSAALTGLLCLSASGCGAHETSAAGPGVITSSQKVDTLDEAGFTQLCDARGGMVEVMPHCGGFASAKGFSYDLATSELSEHSCKGANTCGGWNCVVDP